MTTTAQREQRKNTKRMKRWDRLFAHLDALPYAYARHKIASMTGPDGVITLRVNLPPRYVQSLRRD